MVQVLLPSQLQAYSGGASRVEAAGATIDAVLRDLDGRYPGLRFRVIDEQDRIRPHMRIFVGRERAFDVAGALCEGDELLIFGALSGG
ncbi:molybdopterin synthase sulfur carrier subunit [Caulobacter mirabilis]|uniref:Molybdopterin synthase sulfur carrier subunit n=1 Tax=Caulobacter mirabilis TaxID=69666 RepID=A0A2D2B369_9CAUL|nr:molybdopterin synthase sulfur carrier subunit [Caulobacter mirabilis]ATQ44712.1 molybdopterin synthase sulfur carrier subunit [Caulobacter mirabilis]